MKEIIVKLTDQEADLLTVYCKIFRVRPPDHLRFQWITMLEQLDLLPEDDPEDIINDPEDPYGV
jgi:hypothetical protein